jgi:hypothetical protein
LTTSGSQVVSGIARSSSYTLSCSNAAGSSSVSTTVTVATTISGSPPVTATVGTAYSFTPTAAGGAGSKLTFSVQNLPAWATFNPASGTLSGSPTAAGTFANIVISVSDGTSTASLPAFTITVSAGGSGGNGTATLSWSPPTTNLDGTPVTPIAGYTIYYGTSATALTHTAAVSGAGTTTYTVTHLTAGTWYFAVSANAVDGTISPQSSIGSKTF